MAHDPLLATKIHFLFALISKRARLTYGEMSFVNWIYSISDMGRDTTALSTEQVAEVERLHYELGPVQP